MRHAAFIFLLITLFTAKAWAAPEKSREIDWVTTLELSQSQQKDLHEIEEKYRLKLKGSTSQDCLDDNSEHAKLQAQRHQEIQNLLTPKQAQKAQQVMQKQHRAMLLRQAKELAHQAQMNEKQKARFLAAVEALPAQYHWPLDMAQREKAKAQFDALVHQHLDRSQRQALPRKEPPKWHSPHEFKPLCTLERKGHRLEAVH